MNSKTTHCGVGLLAADMQVMATFYRDVLGLETDWDGGNFEIGLWLTAFADVDAEYEKLKAKGVAVPADGPTTFPFGIRNFYIADPESYLLKIGSDTPNCAGDFGKFGINFFIGALRGKKRSDKIEITV